MVNSNWISFYENTNEHLRKEQLDRIYPKTNFKRKPISTLVGFNKKESESRINKYNRKDICIDCGLVKEVNHNCEINN
jgi:hypothetical protein